MKTTPALIHYSPNNEVRCVCGKAIVERHRTTLMKLVTCPECRTVMEADPLRQREEDGSN